MLKPDSAQNARAGLFVQGALADVLPSREQSFADRVHPALLPYGIDEIDIVLGVKALEHLLVHRIQHQHVRRGDALRVHIIEHRFGEEGERDLLRELRALLQNGLVRRLCPREVAV